MKVRASLIMVPLVLTAMVLLVQGMYMVTTGNSLFFEVQNSPLEPKIITSTEQTIQDQTTDTPSSQNTDDTVDQSINSPPGEREKGTNLLDDTDLSNQQQKKDSQNSKTVNAVEKIDVTSNLKQQLEEMDVQEDDHYCDLNNDGIIDQWDLHILLAYWGPFCECEPNSPDVNNDGIVNVDDLLDELAHWGPCNEDCVWDLTCDNMVNDCDVAVVEAFWNAEGTIFLFRSPDLNGDCVVDVMDLLLLLAEWSQRDPEYGGQINIDDVLAIVESFGQQSDHIHDLTNDGRIDNTDVLSLLDDRV